jgi:hypothetical protein
MLQPLFYLQCSFLYLFLLPLLILICFLVSPNDILFFFVNFSFLCVSLISPILSSLLPFLYNIFSSFLSFLITLVFFFLSLFNTYVVFPVSDS